MNTEGGTEKPKPEREELRTISSVIHHHHHNIITTMTTTEKTKIRA